MPKQSFFSRLGKRTTDGIVGVTSGTTPISSLDSPRAYRTIFVIGLIAIAASGWLVFRSILGATALRQSNNNTTNSVTALAALEKLKTKDTDSDSLSDYDELYSTHTSPYLKDSDGDGQPDNTEVSKGTDPNCPTGKVCEGFRLLTSTTDANGQPTPEFLRRALASAGVSQTVLDQTDDASLLSIYKQVTQGQSTTGTNTNGSLTNAANSNSTLGTTNSSTITNSLVTGTGKSIDQLSSAEIRQLLVENGVDATSLSTVDDATLLQIFSQAVNSSSTQ